LYSKKVSSGSVEEDDETYFTFKNHWKYQKYKFLQIN
jgi:hypothetical protein